MSDISSYLVELFPISDYRSVIAISCVNKLLNSLALIAGFRRHNRIMVVTGKMLQCEHLSYRRRGLIHGVQVVNTCAAYRGNMIANNLSSIIGYSHADTEIEYVYGKLRSLSWINEYGVKEYWHVTRDGLFIHFSARPHGDVRVYLINSGSSRIEARLCYVLASHKWMYQPYKGAAVWIDDNEDAPFAEYRNIINSVIKIFLFLHLTRHLHIRAFSRKEWRKFEFAIVQRI